MSMRLLRLEYNSKTFVFYMNQPVYWWIRNVSKIVFSILRYILTSLVTENRMYWLYSLASRLNFEILMKARP